MIFILSFSVLYPDIKHCLEGFHFGHISNETCIKLTNAQFENKMFEFSVLRLISQGPGSVHVDLATAIWLDIAMTQ